MFPRKEARENHSFKGMIGASLINHYQSEDDEVKLVKSKRKKSQKYLVLISYHTC